MFNVEITRGSADSTLAGTLADCFLSPAKAATGVSKLRESFDKARKSSLNKTAAKLRKRIVERLEQLEKPAEYTNWFNTGSSASISGLIKANKPIKTTKKSGAAKARGYSRKSFIRPPVKATQIGGRFKQLMRYSTTEDNLKVGYLQDFPGSTWAQNFAKFQEGGQVIIKGSNSGSMQKYFGALGMYLRKYPIFNAPKRALIAPVQKANPPETLFTAAFEQALKEGK